MSDMRDKFLELVDEDMLDAQAALEMCVRWLSEDDVAEMMHANEVLIEVEVE